MIPFIIAIVTFYAFIPVIKNMDMKRPLTFASLFQSIRNGFKGSPDYGRHEFQEELVELEGSLLQQRGVLATTVAGDNELETLRLRLEETRNMLVRLIRKYELDMTDEEYERVVNLISSEADQHGATRILREKEASQGVVRMIQPNAAS
jgi:hypothetical protein